MSEFRWTKFFWADYEGDQGLRMCSFAAQGLWMRVLCLMHRCTPYGHLAVNGKAMTDQQVASAVGAAKRDFIRLMAELEQNGVFDRTVDGFIVNRRMVRDRAFSEQQSEYGKKGGNPALKGDKAKPAESLKADPAETLKPEAESEAESKESAPLSLGTGAARSVRPRNLPAREKRFVDPPSEQPALVLAPTDPHPCDDDGRPPGWIGLWQSWMRDDDGNLLPRGIVDQTLASLDRERAAGRLAPLKPRVPLVADPLHTGMADITPDRDGAPTLNGARIDDLHQAVCDAAGMRLEKTRHQQAPLLSWLRDGYRASEILWLVRRVAGRPAYKPPQSLAFFTSAIRADCKTGMRNGFEEWHPQASDHEETREISGS